MKKFARSHWFIVSLFLTGIALTGLGVNWFPLPNMAGIVLIGLSGLLSTGEGRETG